MRIGILFVGEVKDRGFNAAALAGVEVVRAGAEAHGHRIEILSGIPFHHAAMTAAMEHHLPALDGLVFVGGQGDSVLPDVAMRHPDRLFAIVQGHHCAPNLASYDVLQEESAFLAGYLAARMTASGVVAHLSGHRVRPGLKGRAAFAAGVRHADPGLRLLTAFCGTQDDTAITHRWAGVQIEAGADILFTMLNGGREGAIAACAGRAWQIGNVLDWCAIRPDVFLASAEARIDLGLARAVSDMMAGHMPSTPQRFGLAAGGMVRLSLSPAVPAAVAREIAALAEAIARGEIAIPEDYAGEEFQPGPDCESGHLSAPGAHAPDAGDSDAGGHHNG